MGGLLRVWLGHRCCCRVLPAGSACCLLLSHHSRGKPVASCRQFGKVCCLQLNRRKQQSRKRSEIEGPGTQLHTTKNLVWLAWCLLLQAVPCVRLDRQLTDSDKLHCHRVAFVDIHVFLWPALTTSQPLHCVHRAGGATGWPQGVTRGAHA